MFTRIKQVVALPVLPIYLGCIGCTEVTSKPTAHWDGDLIQRTWEFDDGSSYEELVVLTGDDYEVVYTNEFPQKYTVRFSDLWDIACDKPFPGKKDRHALQALRKGEVNEITIATPFGPRSFIHEGEQTISLLNQSYDVIVVTDYDLDYYFLKDAGKLIGWYESANELLTGLRKTKSKVDVDANIVKIAKEKCTPEPFEN